MFLSIIIPAYNESENILHTISELEKLIVQQSLVKEYEIIIVDDHSSDNTFDVVKSIEKNNIKSLRLSRRSGSHTALRAGLTKANGNAMLCISADGQDNPSVLLQMLEKIKLGSHTVWALREDRNEPLLAKLFTFIFYKLLKLMTQNDNKGINLSKADFFLLSRKVVDAINNCQEKNTSLFGLLIWIGFKQDYVFYERRDRMAGKSKWNFKSRMKLAKDWLLAFSGIPLKFIMYIGFFTASVGFLYALFIVVYAILGHSPQGWASTTTLILIIGGVQMIMLGIIGEYIGRNLDESRKRPLYFIEEDTDE